MQDLEIGERGAGTGIKRCVLCSLLRDLCVFSSKIRCQEEITIYNTVYQYTLRPLLSHSTSGPGPAVVQLWPPTHLSPIPTPGLSRLERLRAQVWQGTSQLPMPDVAGLSGVYFELNNTDLYKIRP